MSKAYQLRREASAASMPALWECRTLMGPPLSHREVLTVYCNLLIPTVASIPAAAGTAATEQINSI